jgi:HK97 family phage portal protein
MIIRNLAIRNVIVAPVPNSDYASMVEYPYTNTRVVTIESSRRIHIAFRCMNILSDDIGSMPLQTFQKVGERLNPADAPGNIAWLLEVEPNRWMNPFIFKKTIILWLLNWGASYIWMRPGAQELIILPSDATVPLYEISSGNLWYQVTWPYWSPMYNPNRNPVYYPDVEVLKLLINSDDGITGRSVMTFARESMERQLGAHDTQGRFYKQGLNPGGILWMAGELNKEAREKVRETYEEAMSGSENAYRLAILDSKATKFEQISMSPDDAQFLESIQATDVEIANYYGIPLFKLNSGKQSYESNAQLDLDYLKTTLNPYLTQWENEAKRKWLTQAQLARGWYHKFNRAEILATDANNRAVYLEKKILSGQMTPNESRAIEDQPPYPGGDSHYIPANIGQVLPDGSIKTGGAAPASTPAGGK